MSPGIIQMKRNAAIIPLLAEEGWRDSLIEAGAPGWREARARSGEASIEVRVPSTNGRAQIPSHYRQRVPDHQPVDLSPPRNHRGSENRPSLTGLLDAVP